MLTSTFLAVGQNSYYMSNGSTGDCNGFFYDSDAGLTAGNYGHSESYVFTICVPLAQNITVKFKTFCLEFKNDSLEAFDGNSVSATKIGGWTGTNNPGTVSSTGQCITFRFSSDLSVACSGWEAEWTTSIKQVVPQTFVPTPAVSCKDNSIVLKMNSKLNCDTIKKKMGFQLLGPNAPAVSNFTPINCNSDNETDEIRLNLSKGVDRSGNYKLRYTTVVPDPCDSLWVFKDSITFKVTDCPINVDLSVDYDTICQGQCANITAQVTGGNPSNYSYSWNNSVSGTSPVKVCPNSTTDYILTVSDGQSVPGKDTIRIVVLAPPTMPNDTIICRDGPKMDFDATPAGGTWLGAGITDKTNGDFDPYLAGRAVHMIKYALGGSCLDSFKVDVRTIWGGAANTACPGSGPFQAFSYGPAGGTFTGMYISPTGLITPPHKDTSWRVTYHWKGCSINKWIHITEGAVEKRYDTICLSDPIKRMNPSPRGGIWRGPGVTNWYYCDFDPVKAGPGNHILSYDMKGCSDTTFMYVVDIDARYNEVACPKETPFDVVAGTPVGGYWKGTGIIDSTNGTFDPSIPPVNANVTLTYHLGGCTDTKLMYVRDTRVYVDTLKFCVEDTNTALVWQSVQRTPGGGNWVGNGIVNDTFYPTIAGYGTHNLVYTANSCSDSVTFVIHPQADIQTDTNFCIGNEPYKLRDASNKGEFFGKGITNSKSGMFNPKVAGVGSHKIYYFSEFGCIDSLTITVDPLPVVSFSGLSTSYCFKDTNYTLTGVPAGGTFTGNGILGDQFNPSIAGTGSHDLKYEYGVVGCSTSQTKSVDVKDTLILEVSIDDDSICPGENAQIFTNVRGGNIGFYKYNWSSGQGNVTSILVNPSSTTNYTVTVSDGCSDDQQHTAEIFVHPQPNGRINTSPIQCYGNDGWAKVIMQGNDPYSYYWNTNPANLTDSVFAPVSTFLRLTATNLRTQCEYNAEVTIPAYSYIKAAFNTVPRNKCLNNLTPELWLIDQSVGGLRGTWYFGDGNTADYNGTNPRHTYAADTNKYTVKLLIENEGGCFDSAFADICMDDSVVLFVPNAFTPNSNDYINATLAIKGGGITEYDLIIINRWGEVVFKSNDLAEEWDGTHGGKECPQGLYGYRIVFRGKKTRYYERSGGVYLFR